MAMAEPQVIHDESLGSLLRGIMTDLRTLVREEIALARVEIRDQVGRARSATVSFGVAAGALLFGGTFLLITVALGIADVMDWPAWSGFLIVAVFLSVVGAIALSSGRKQLAKVHAVPQATVSTLKENSEWIAKRLSSVRR